MDGPSTKGKPVIYNERTAIVPLQKGETVQVKAIGNSMEPLIKSHTVVTILPLKLEDKIEKGDIVLCKVSGQIFIHKVSGLKGNYVQISNNRGHINGWTPRDKVYGRYQRTNQKD